MKPSDFKKIIKEAVKEAIQEELKDILLEAVRAPNFQPQGPVDAINGTLPEGNVGLDQIMALMGGK